MAIAEAISYNPESSLTLNEKAESLCVKNVGGCLDRLTWISLVLRSYGPLTVFILKERHLYQIP